MQQHYLLSMSNYYIHHTVKITDSSVFIDEHEVFSVAKDEKLGSFLKQVYKQNQVAYSKYFKMDKLSKLGFLSAELLLRTAGINNLHPNETAIVLANSASSLHTDHNFQQTVDDIPSPAVFVYTLANIVIGEICIKHDIKGETAFFVQNKFDVDFMTEYANIVMSNTATKQCILGWVEVNANEEYEATMALISNDKSSRELNTDNVKSIFK